QRHRARWFGVLEERRHGVEGTNRVLACADYSDRAGRGTALRCARAVGLRGRRIGPCSNLRAHDLVNAFQLMAQTDEFFFIRAAVEVRGCLHPARGRHRRVDLGQRIQRNLGGSELRTQISEWCSCESGIDLTVLRSEEHTSEL